MSESTSRSEEFQFSGDTLLAPQLAAIGAIAALVLKGSIVIEKETPPAGQAL